jgi:hypothetical protein
MTKRLITLRGCLSCMLFICAFVGVEPAALADTVYLKNGAWIDGVAIQRDDAVLVRIGEIGRVELELDDVYAIERNSLTGSETTAAAVQARGVEITPQKVDQEDPGAADESAPRDGPDEAKSGEKRDAGNEGASSSKSQAAGDAEVEAIAPELKALIEKHVADLKRDQAKFRVRAERHLKRVGTVAIPFLIPLVRDGGEQTRVAVMRLFLGFGDERVVDPCIGALLDSNEYVRDFAQQTLRRVTLENFGFHANASPRRRRFAQQKWAKWWRAEQKELEEVRALTADKKKS